MSFGRREPFRGYGGGAITVPEGLSSGETTDFLDDMKRADPKKFKGFERTSDFSRGITAVMALLTGYGALGGLGGGASAGGTGTASGGLLGGSAGGTGTASGGLFSSFSGGDFLDLANNIQGLQGEQQQPNNAAHQQAVEAEQRKRQSLLGFSI